MDDVLGSPIFWAAVVPAVIKSLTDIYLRLRKPPGDSEK
jgi:hypothetical protein